MASFLIVDEDHNHRESLAIALRLDGHAAVVSPDADRAATLLAEERFDCCVVDGRLPGADALLETAARSGARAIATGPYLELLAAAAARHPHADLIEKPFQAAELAARVLGAEAR
jgi:DNA-binding NtrC family response regulator